MSTSEVHHLFHHPIADHSFSADHGCLAVARDTDVVLYTRSGGVLDIGKRSTKEENDLKKATEEEQRKDKEKRPKKLEGHDKTVTSVDIAPKSGRIVSCSQGKLRNRAHNRRG